MTMPIALPPRTGSTVDFAAVGECSLDHIGVLDGWPAWIFQSVIPIGFAIMCWRFVLQALRTARAREKEPGP